MILTPAQINDLLRGHTLTIDGMDIRCEDDAPAQDSNMVSVAPLRDAFKRSGLSAGQLAKFVGWADQSRPRQVFKQDSVNIETAQKLATALGLDPHEAGF